MSRDLTAEERKAFVDRYGAGASCENCGTDDVIVKIWENYGSTAREIGGDIGPDGIVGAVVACDHCGHGQTVARPRIKAAAG